MLQIRRDDVTQRRAVVLLDTRRPTNQRDTGLQAKCALVLLMDHTLGRRHLLKH